MKTRCIYFACLILFTPSHGRAQQASNPVETLQYIATVADYIDFPFGCLGIGRAAKRLALFNCIASNKSDQRCESQILHKVKTGRCLGKARAQFVAASTNKRTFTAVEDDFFDVPFACSGAKSKAENEAMESCVDNCLSSCRLLQSVSFHPTAYLELQSDWGEFQGKACWGAAKVVCSD